MHSSTGKGMAAMQLRRSDFQKIMDIDKYVFGRCNLTKGAVVLCQRTDVQYPLMFRVVDVDFEKESVVLSDGRWALVKYLVDLEANEFDVESRALTLIEATFRAVSEGSPRITVAEVCMWIRIKLVLAGAFHPALSSRLTLTADFPLIDT